MIYKVLVLVPVFVLASFLFYQAASYYYDYDWAAPRT
jgi:hypothetical protein